jgi:hypothetical protein
MVNEAFLEIEKPAQSGQAFQHQIPQALKNT